MKWNVHLWFKRVWCAKVVFISFVLLNCTKCIWAKRAWNAQPFRSLAHTLASNSNEIMIVTFSKICISNLEYQSQTSVANFPFIWPVPWRSLRLFLHLIFKFFLRNGLKIYHSQKYHSTNRYNIQTFWMLSQFICLDISVIFFITFSISFHFHFGRQGFFFFRIHTWIRIMPIII